MVARLAGIALVALFVYTRAVRAITTIEEGRGWEPIPWWAVTADIVILLAAVVCTAVLAPSLARIQRSSRPSTQRY